jgi:hypothetical protein
MEALVSGGRSLLEPSARNQAGKGIGIMGEVYCLSLGKFVSFLGDNNDGEFIGHKLFNLFLSPHSQFTNTRLN